MRTDFRRVASQRQRGKKVQAYAGCLQVILDPFVPPTDA